MSSVSGVTGSFGSNSWQCLNKRRLLGTLPKNFFFLKALTKMTVFLFNLRGTGLYLSWYWFIGLFSADAPSVAVISVLVNLQFDLCMRTKPSEWGQQILIWTYWWLFISLPALKCLINVSQCVFLWMFSHVHYKTKTKLNIIFHSQRAEIKNENLYIWAVK